MIRISGNKNTPVAIWMSHQGIQEKKCEKKVINESCGLVSETKSD